MSWRKERGHEKREAIDNVFLGMLIFFGIGLFFQQPLAFMVVGILGAHYILNRIYDQNLENSLDLLNPKHTVRLFPEEQAVLKLEVENRSFFPLANGELKFQLADTVRVEPPFEATNNEATGYSLPLSFIGKKKTTIEMPLKAEKRGTARMYNIKYHFPHLFNFDWVVMRHDISSRTELVVFPAPLPVKGMDSFMQMNAGPQRSNLSPFEDVQSPLGTREYNYSDPFYRINWKATAKTQRLQTNVYEKAVDISYLLIVNLSSESSANRWGVNPELETILSHTAFLSQSLTEKGYPFEIFINLRKHGKNPYVQVPEGVGKMHYVNALETLARINPLSSTMPFDQMLAYIGKQSAKPSTVIIIGEVPQDAVRIMDSWKNNRNKVFQVVDTEEGAVIGAIGKGGVTHAI